MARGFARLPVPLQLSKPHPVRLIEIAVVVATVPDLDQKANSFEALHGADDGAPAPAHEVCNPVKAWVALLGAIIETVDDGSGDLLLGAGQSARKADRFK